MTVQTTVTGASDAGRARLDIGIRALLEWAFGTECAHLDYSPVSALAGHRPPFGMEYVLMERARLGGVRIDTSVGVSTPHDDADVIASVVRDALVWPDAVRVMELARAGRVPDWMPGARPRLRPVAWKHANGSRSREGKTDVAWVHAETRTMRHPRNPLCTMTRTYRTDVRYTPCTWVPAHATIAAARRSYLDWWGHLLTIRAALSGCNLQRFRLTNAMPPMTPWKKTFDKPSFC